MVLALAPRPVLWQLYRRKCKSNLPLPVILGFEFDRLLVCAGRSSSSYSRTRSLRPRVATGRACSIAHALRTVRSLTLLRRDRSRPTRSIQANDSSSAKYRLQPERARAMAATGTGIGQRDVAHLEHRNHTNIGLSNHKVRQSCLLPAVFPFDASRQSGGIAIIVRRPPTRAPSPQL